jgi:hypothetical protein
MTAARTRQRPAAKKPVPAADEPTLASFDRDIDAVMRRYRQREASFEEIVEQRDSVIRAAMAAGVPRAHLAERTGLSVPRLDQIRAGRR